MIGQVDYYAEIGARKLMEHCKCQATNEMKEEEFEKDFREITD